MIAQIPKLHYYAVIFTSHRTPDDKGYSEMSEALGKEVQQLHGFFGFESLRNEIGIRVSYWKDIDSIVSWKNHEEHRLATETGKSTGYSHFKVRICKVERDYGWNLK